MPKRILVTPLDWGLGHATRSIPVINEFLNKGCEVQIASSGDALLLLKREFPELKFHELVSYKVSYSAWLAFSLKIILQLPKFLKAIKEEHALIEQIIKNEKIDFIVSDNRYGCWSAYVPSVLIIHQVHLITPIFNSIVNKFHSSSIKKFSHCWVPDVAGDESLAGVLSVNNQLKVEYVGILSRMKRMSVAKKYQLLVIISGPEPQRSIFEKIIRDELKPFDIKFFIVRGIPGESNNVHSSTEANHLPAEELNKIIEESELIISRSGYSTIMDLAAIGANAVFVPTPGQPEQEYLASRLMEQKIAYCMSQDKFNLAEAIRQSKNYTGFKVYQRDASLSNAVKSLLNEIN